MFFCALCSARMRAAPLAPLLALIAGCSGGGGGGESPGGFVRVEHRRNSDGAEATFARAEFTDVAQTRPARGRCAVPEPAADGAWRDVGEAVTLTRAGADPLVLPRATLGSLVVYGADGLPALASPAGAELDVALAGNEEIEARTWEDAVEIPAPLEPGELLNQIGFSADQTLSWAPSEAEEVLLEITSGVATDLVCRARGSDGELVIPEAQNAELFSGGGAVVFRAVTRRHATLDGTRVALEGQSVVIVPYQ